MTTNDYIVKRLDEVFKEEREYRKEVLDKMASDLFDTVVEANKELTADARDTAISLTKRWFAIISIIQILIGSGIVALLLWVFKN